MRMSRLLLIPRRAAALPAAVPAPNPPAPVYMGQAFAHHGPARFDALRKQLRP